MEAVPPTVPKLGSWEGWGNFVFAKLSTNTKNIILRGNRKSKAVKVKLT